MALNDDPRADPARRPLCGQVPLPNDRDKGAPLRIHRLDQRTMALGDSARTALLRHVVRLGAQWLACDQTIGAADQRVGGTVRSHILGGLSVVREATLWWLWLGGGAREGADNLQRAWLTQSSAVLKTGSGRQRHSWARIPPPAAGCLLTHSDEASDALPPATISP
jgi:hypothetical protein